MRTRVEAANQRQMERFDGKDGVTYNADMHPAEVRMFCVLDETGKNLMQSVETVATLGASVS